MTVKDLFENEELVNNIVEDIDDLPEDTPVCYEVWALGYASDEEPTTDEVLLGEFLNPDEAVKCAEATTLERIYEMGFGEPDVTTAYFAIEVETVIDDPDDDGTINIGSIYSRDLWPDGVITC